MLKYLLSDRWNLIRLDAPDSPVSLRPPRRGDWREWTQTREKSRSFLSPWDPKWPDRPLDRKYYMARYKIQKTDWKHDRRYSFHIFLKEGGALIGGININRVTRGAAQMGSLGYWMAKEHTQKGYMSAAMDLVVDYAFSELGLHRLEAACLTHNVASTALLRKKGFAEEGLARKYLKIANEWQDHALFGLVKVD